jgi:hypothetical protein
MFHFMDQQDPGQDFAGRDLGARIMAAEYNLAVQREGARKAAPAGILAQILGELLQERAAR